MANKNYQEPEVIKQLEKKMDIRVNSRYKQIQELNGKGSRGDVGSKSRGKIDFLINYCGFTHFYVAEFQS